MARTQVNFRVGENTRKRWEAHVQESPHYDKVSDLIKQAVRNQIERDNGAGGFDVPEVDVDAVSGGQSGEVLERIQDLHNRFEDLQADVSDAVDAVHAQRGVDANLAPDVFQALPTGQEDAMSAEDLARTIGRKDAEVRFALENLRRNTNTVKKRGQSDSRQDVTWYKTEGA